MNWFKRAKIDFQRWRFIKSRSAEQKMLLKKKERAIKEADRLCAIDNKRRYVFLLDYNYEIVSTIDVAAINRKLPKGVRWDIVKVMKNCVYHTK
jgi:hypothetical protein